MAKWYLVRHGETAWNAEGRLQGHHDIAINERGRQQAECLKGRLSSSKFSAAYSSDLTRCIDTMGLVLNGAKVPLLRSSLLREQTFGQWEGLSYEQIEAREPKLYAEMMRAYEDFVPPGGESFRQVSERIRTFIGNVRAKHADRKILVVGHGGSLRALIMALLEMPLMSGWRMKLDSCGLTILEVGTKGAALELLNDTSHLKEAE